MRQNPNLHKEIEKLNKAKTYGISRIDQLEEEREDAAMREERRTKHKDDDMEDFIDNRDDDIEYNKLMKKVKVSEGNPDDIVDEDMLEEEADQRFVTGALAKSLQNMKVSFRSAAADQKANEKGLREGRPENQRDDGEHVQGTRQPQSRPNKHLRASQRSIDGDRLQKIRLG